MKRCVFVTFPASPAHPYLHKQTVFCSWRILADSRHKVKMIIPSHNPFENNLHHCVNQFIQEEEHDFWLSIDYDNPPMRNPLDLIEYDRDIIGLPTPVWHNDTQTTKPGERPLYYNAYDYVPEADAYKEHDQKEGLQRVDAIGTGCFLISRRVFLDDRMQKGAFHRTYNEDGTVNKGNDLAFCERARACGFEIWCHYAYPCMHFNNLELNEVVSAFRNLYESPSLAR